MPLLLTGAAGFIGSNVLKALNDKGRDDIICVDDLSNGAKCQNLAGKKFYRYYDYRDDVALFAQHEITEIVHLGANVDTTCSDGRAIVHDNYTYSVRLLEALNARNFQHRHMVYASSAAVYGDAASKSADEFCEKPECEKPKSPYAVSKWMFDEFVRRWFSDFEFEDNAILPTGLRFFNVYGPGEQHKGRMRSAIGNMINDINEGRRPKLFEGSEWLYRDFVWIDDVVRTVLWALDTRPKGIFNVGTGVARSFMEAYQAVATAMDYDGHPQYVDFPADLPHYQYFTCAKLVELRTAKFLDGFTPLEDGVEQYVARQDA